MVTAYDLLHRQPTHFTALWLVPLLLAVTKRTARTSEYRGSQYDDDDGSHARTTRGTSSTNTTRLPKPDDDDDDDDEGTSRKDSPGDADVARTPWNDAEDGSHYETEWPTPQPVGVVVRMPCTTGADRATRRRWPWEVNVSTELLMSSSSSSSSCSDQDNTNTTSDDNNTTIHQTTNKEKRKSPGIPRAIIAPEDCANPLTTVPAVVSKKLVEMGAQF
mmetsp:Transcript_23608/g.50105  ORF Transcript_23608/g.50105 Transcript_23608/m.50105 type:complete len:218 (-) Transcript_23608:54-707(-)